MADLLVSTMETRRACELALIEAMRGEGIESYDGLASSLDLSQQEGATVRRDVTAVEVRADFSTTRPLEHQPAVITLCSHLTVWLLVRKRLRKRLYAGSGGQMTPSR